MSILTRKLYGGSSGSENELISVKRISNLALAPGAWYDCLQEIDVATSLYTTYDGDSNSLIVMRLLTNNLSVGWCKKYELSASGYTYSAHTAKIDADTGYIYIVGRLKPTSGDNVPVIISIDASGNLRWAKKYAAAVGFTRDASIIDVTDSTYLKIGLNGPTKTLIYEVSKSDGTFRSGSGYEKDYPGRDTFVLSNGGILSVGYSSSGGSIYVSEANAGYTSIVNSRYFGAPSQAIWAETKVDSSGNYITITSDASSNFSVSRWTYDPDASPKMAVSKVCSLYLSEDYGGYGQLHSVITDTNDDVYVVGFLADNSSLENAVTIVAKIDSTLSEVLWAKRIEIENTTGYEVRSKFVSHVQGSKEEFIVFNVKYKKDSSTNPNAFVKIRTDGKMVVSDTLDGIDIYVKDHLGTISSQSYSLSSSSDSVSSTSFTETTTNVSVTESTPTLVTDDESFGSDDYPFWIGKLNVSSSYGGYKITGDGNGNMYAFGKSGTAELHCLKVTSAGAIAWERRYSSLTSPSVIDVIYQSSSLWFVAVENDKVLRFSLNASTGAEVVNSMVSETITNLSSITGEQARYFGTTLVVCGWGTGGGETRAWVLVSSSSSTKVATFYDNVFLGTNWKMKFVTISPYTYLESSFRFFGEAWSSSSSSKKFLQASYDLASNTLTSCEVGSYSGNFTVETGAGYDYSHVSFGNGPNEIFISFDTDSVKEIESNEAYTATGVVDSDSNEFSIYVIGSLSDGSIAIQGLSENSPTTPLVRTLRIDNASGSITPVSIAASNVIYASFNYDGYVYFMKLSGFLEESFTASIGVEDFDCEASQEFFSVTTTLEAGSTSTRAFDRYSNRSNTPNNVSKSSTTPSTTLTSSTY